jgi:hypothetical protein
VNPRVLVVAIAIGLFVGGIAYLVVPRRPVIAPVTTAPAPTPRREPVTPTATTPEVAAPAAPTTAAPRAARRASAAKPTEPAAEPEIPVATELGTLRIASDVPGAQVFIDRQFIGNAPVTAERIKRARIN